MGEPKRKRVARRASPPLPTAPFVFDSQVVDAGTRREFSLPIARLPAGTWANMPVVIVHGTRPGPVVWCNGAIHGDELNGVEIVRQLSMLIDPTALTGTVIAVPIVNAFGVTAGSRYLPGGRDLNRSFPGSARGSLAARLAHVFFSEIVRRCEIGIDFHTGTSGRKNLPHIRCDVVDPETLRLGQAFGARLVLAAPQRVGSLRAAAAKQGIRVLLYEGGEADRLDETAIAVGRDGAMRVLGALGMLDEAPPPTIRVPTVCKTSAWMRANRSGLCRVEVGLGHFVHKGQPLAVVHDAVGSAEQVVKSRVAGIVIGVLRTAVVHRGDSIVHVAAAPHG